MATLAADKGCYPNSDEELKVRRLRIALESQGCALLSEHCCSAAQPCSLKLSGYRTALSEFIIIYYYYYIRHISLISRSSPWSQSARSIPPIP